MDKSTPPPSAEVVLKVVDSYGTDGATSTVVLRHFAVTDALRASVLKILSSKSARRFNARKPLVREKKFSMATKGEVVSYVSKKYLPQAHTAMEPCYLCGASRILGGFSLSGGAYGGQCRQAHRLKSALPLIMCEFCYRRNFTPEHCSHTTGAFLCGFAVLPSCWDAAPFLPFPETSPFINMNLKRIASSVRRPSMDPGAGAGAGAEDARRKKKSKTRRTVKENKEGRRRHHSSRHKTISKRRAHGTESDTHSESGEASAKAEAEFVETFRRRAENDLLEQFATPSGRAFLEEECAKQGRSIAQVTAQLVAQVREAAGKKATKLHRKRMKGRRRQVKGSDSSSTDGGGSSATGQGGRALKTNGGRKGAAGGAAGSSSSPSGSSSPSATSPSSAVFKTLKLEYTGNLHMRKSALFKKGWAWRLVKLRGITLCCYDDDGKMRGTAKLKCKFDLTHCAVMHSSEDRATGRPHTFRIVDGKGKYVAVFAASTAMEEQEWIDRINQSIVFADSQTEFKTTPRASKAGKPRKAARP